MPIGRIFDIAGLIVAVAGITVVVSSKNTSGIINAFGNSFSNSLKAAMGQYS